MAEAGRNWSGDAGELAACFTVHARDLFGHACVLADADRDLAGDLVQATFEAAAGVWCTLRDLPADQCHDWLRDTLAAAAQRQTGHPAGRAFVSPSHRRLTELKTARFRSDYDAAAGLERFTCWLRTRAPGPPASLRALREEIGPDENAARRERAIRERASGERAARRTGLTGTEDRAVRTEPGQAPRQGVTVTR